MELKHGLLEGYKSKYLSGNHSFCTITGPFRFYVSANIVGMCESG